MVTKAHRGMMHVPRGRRRPPRTHGDPRRPRRRRGWFGRGSWDRGRLTRQEREQRDKIRDAQLLALKNKYGSMTPQERINFRNTSVVPKEIQQAVAEERMPGTIRQGTTRTEPRKPRRPTVDPRRPPRDPRKPLTGGSTYVNKYDPRRGDDYNKLIRSPATRYPDPPMLARPARNKGGLMKKGHNDMRKKGLFK